MENHNDIENIKNTIYATLQGAGVDSFDIYLFGSRARGDFSQTSDYDLLIIPFKKMAMKSKIKLFGKLSRILAKKRYNADIVIKSRDEVNYYKDKIGHVVRSALSEGILL